MNQYEKHMSALNTIAEKVKRDPNVIALLLSGSLSYGKVWEKSDIDLTLIVRDGAVTDKNTIADYCLEEEGVEIHLSLDTVSRIKEEIRSMRGGEDIHSYLGLGRFVFSKDDSLIEIFEEMKTVGREDAKLSFINAAEGLIIYKIKAEKYLTLFGDLLYAQNFLIRCSYCLGDMIMLCHGQDPDREQVLHAMELEPEAMAPLYIDPMTRTMSEDEIRRAIDHMDNYLVSHMDWWSEPIVRYLSDGEPRKVSQIINHFGVGGMFYTLSYLAEHGVLIRLTQESRVFKNSKFTLDEVAYMMVKE